MSRHFKAYDLMAIHAGLACGLKLPTVEQAFELTDKALNPFTLQVADDPQARQLRDRLFAEFRAKLLDTQLTLQEIVDWFKVAYGPVTLSSIHRARVDAQAQEAPVAQCADLANKCLEIARAEGAGAVFDASSQLAGQYIFQILLQAQAALSGGEADTGGMVKVIGALAKLQQSKAQADLLMQKTRELRTEFDRQMQAAKREADGAGGKFTDDMIAKVRKAMFGEAA